MNNTFLQILTRADDSDTGYLKIWIYVLTGVFSFVCVILLACVIALFVQVNKLSSNLKKIKEERSKDAVGIQDYKIRYDLFEGCVQNIYNYSEI